MSTIWIDLTDIEKWSGNHGGIQRVVYGITKNYYLNQESSEQNLKFFIYSGISKALHETDFAPIYDRVETLKSGNGISNPQSRKAKIKDALRYYTPALIRKNERIRSAVGRTGKFVFKTVRQARANSQDFRLKLMRSARGEKVYFAQGDTVLILGKPWDDLGIQKLLSEQKQKTKFTLAQIVYDLVIPLYPHLHHPSLFVPYTQHLFEAISASDLLLPISESSAKDLRMFCEKLSLPVPEVRVIRLGDDIVNQAENIPRKPDIRIEDKFVASIGTIEIRKNHMLLYYAYKLAAEKGIDLPQLLIVGSNGWLSSDFQHLIKNDPRVASKIIILNHISDIGLEWVYKNSLFTIYPSMYEGWGLPVAESLAYGKACIASNASSIPEIAGDMIDYFSPYNSKECLEKIMDYLKDDHCLVKEKEICKNYKSTTWEDTYNQMMHYLKGTS